MQYSITNPQGATLRIGPSTSAGVIRKAPLGTLVNVVNTVKANAGRETWLVLTEIDPTTGLPWRHLGAEVTAYVALTVGATIYAAPVEGGETPPEEPGNYTDGYNDGWNAHYRSVRFENPGPR